MRILILGGTGFVGRRIAARLVDPRYKVLIPTRNYHRHRDLTVMPTVRLVEGDVHDPAFLRRLFHGMDAVINLVGILNESGRETFQRAHVELARNVVGACEAMQVPRLLHMSSINADPAGPSKYLRSKGEAEAIVSGSSLAWSIFRPSVVFGAGDSFTTLFARLARALPVVVLAGADAKFQPVWVGDVVTAFERTLRRTSADALAGS